MTRLVTVERPVATDPPVPATRERRSVERLRLTLIVLGLTLAVFGQSAGNTATDTKIDLVVSPLRFLGRALRLWDPIGDAGQLQNQSYGYLFPMGPFFVALHAVGVAPWEIQRAWEAVIVVAAFLGTYLLAKRLGIASFWPAVGAGLVYALAPRVLGELTSISAELMPVAALPWVLLPLVTGATRGSPRRAAALSAVALLFAGGVNAAATLAILPVPALWLLTRGRGPRRRALIGWWVLSVALACLWWALPLLELGRYSPPFLDWVEPSSTTTLPTSLLATLRGVDHWEAYLGPSIWPGAWILASAAVAVVATTVVAGAGLVGLSRRGIPHRAFLWSCLLLGLLLVTAGHAASVGPPGSAWTRTMLDGALVPFRNVHKFDPVVRLPISLGVGFLLARMRLPREALVGRGRERLRIPVRTLAAVAAIGVGLIAITPVLTNHLVSSQRISTEPTWWRSAASWLGQHSGGARALVVPGSASPQYLWGGTIDNALQPVATTPWTGRDAVPLTQAGYVRLLNEIEIKLATGAADPTLAPLLARAGIGYVVMANDLNTLSSGSTPLLYVRATLNTSPGLSLKASFGPRLGGGLSPTVLLDSGATIPQPAVQIYRVAGWSGRASLQPLTGAVEATGATDALAQLLRRGLSPQTPVLFGADAGGVPVADPVQVTTDGIRKRESSFAGILTSSVTLSANAPYTSSRKVHDYLPDNAGQLSVLRYSGIADVSASSAGDGTLAYVNRGDRNGAWSALDGDPATSWKSTGFNGAVGQWLQVRFRAPVSLPSVAIAFGVVQSALPTSVVVRTDAGQVVDAVTPDYAPQVLRVPSGSTRTLRITIGSVVGGSHGVSAAISSLGLPGLTAGRALDVPSYSSPAVLAFDAADGYRANCLDVSGTAICDPNYARSGQEDGDVSRSFATGTPATYTPQASVRLTGGPQLDAQLDEGASITASASSVNSADPRQRPGAAVDDNPLTTWQAAAGDTTPSLTLHLGRPREVKGVRLTTPFSAPVAGLVRVTVRAGDETWTGRVPQSGHLVLPHPVRARTITITVDEANLRPTTNTTTLATRLLPVGIAEVTVDGYRAAAPDPSRTVTIGCASGLALNVDGSSLPLRVTASRAAVLAGGPVTATLCDGSTLDLPAGSHQVSLAATAQALPVSVTLTRAGTDLAVPAPSAGRMQVRSWGATSRQVRVDTSAAALLVVHENANLGWQATVNGARLAGARVDGWEQAFVVPAGVHGVVHLSYAPQQQFVVGLLAGAVAVLAVLLLALARRGRTDHPALGTGTAHRLLGAILVTGAFALLGGWAAVLTLAALAGATRLIARSRFALRSWVSGFLLVIAAILVARGQRVLIFADQNSSLTQLLCIAALATGVLAAVALPRHGRDP